MRILDLGQQAIQDLQYALRMMARQPFFTAMATLSLALGIGANTAIYSFMDAILLRALPVPNPETLVVLNWRSKDHPPVARSHWGSNFKDPKIGNTSGDFPFAAYELLRTNNPVLSSVFAFKAIGRLNVLIRGQADLANGQYVSGEFFRGLGVPPAAGRLIDDSDDRSGAPPVVTLGFEYARRRFGDDRRRPGPGPGSRPNGASRRRTGRAKPERNRFDHPSMAHGAGVLTWPSRRPPTPTTSTASSPRWRAVRVAARKGRR